MGILIFLRNLFRANKDIEEPFFTKDIFKNSKYIIGDYTYGHPIVLYENENANLHIGKFCSIAKDVTVFLGGNHRTDWVTTFPFNDLAKYFPELSNIKGHPATKGDVIINNDVWIGRGVTIMSGVRIANGAVIAANSTLTKNVGPYELWGGNPAKFISKRFTDEEIRRLDKISWWNWDIRKIRANAHLLCSSNVIKLMEENL